MAVVRNILGLNLLEYLQVLVGSGMEVSGLADLQIRLEPGGPGSAD
jgi:hypothetical protein